MSKLSIRGCTLQKIQRNRIGFQKNCNCTSDKMQRTWCVWPIYLFIIFNCTNLPLKSPSNIVSLQVFVHVSRFSPYAINLARNKDICCGLKKGVAKSRALVYFERQILALLLVFHQTHNLSRNKCRHDRSTPSKSTNQRAAFLQPATNVFVAEKVDRAR